MAASQWMSVLSSNGHQIKKSSKLRPRKPHAEGEGEKPERNTLMDMRADLIAAATRQPK